MSVFRILTRSVKFSKTHVMLFMRLFQLLRLRGLCIEYRCLNSPLSKNSYPSFHHWQILRLLTQRSLILAL